MSVAAALVTCLVLSGCGFTAKAGTTGQAVPVAKARPGRAAATAAAPLATVGLTPRAGRRSVRPDTVMRVTVAHGTLVSVTVADTRGGAVAGTVDTASTVWTASGLLAPASRYLVRAVAVNRDGRLTRLRAAFSTLRPAVGKRLKASSIVPRDGSVVGVAQPLVVGFNHPVRDRAAAQAALHVTTVPPVAGAWYWIDDSSVDFRPRTFWPAGTRVSLHADLAGVDAGGGMWGMASRSIGFTVDRRQLIRVDIRRHRMTVERDGKVLRTFPVTSGKPGWETRNGTKVIMEKVRNKTWTNEAIDAPEHFRLHSDFALRMTNSGEFLHDAAWSLGNIGRVSASHGCVGMRPADARWLFEHTDVGDAVIVTGSPRPYTELWNRYADWNVPWTTWRAGNA